MYKLRYYNPDVVNRISDSEIRIVNVDDFNLAINISEDYCKQKGYELIAVWDVEKLNK